MKLTSIYVAVAMSLALGACHGGKSEIASGEAVKVNGQAISVAELNEKSGNAHTDAKTSVPGPILKMTIETELLRQAAVQEKLDVDADVHARIANSTRMILATAYMQKQLAAIAKPGDADVAAYFNQNPERFAQRQQYQFQEFSIQPPAGKASEVQALAAKVKSPDELEKWLAANNIPHSSTPATTTGDQLPDAVMQKLKGVKAGGSVVLGDGKQLNVVFVLSEQPQPMLLAQASAAITNQLWDKRKRETLEKMMKQLHDKAKIEYVAPFTENGFSAPATPH